MKLAVTATGNGMDAAMDDRFGRCSYFVVVDTDTGGFEAVANDPMAASGAGINAAQLLIGRDVEAVVTGHCGPKAFEVLAAAGIAVHAGASGTVGEAVEAFRRGDLAPVQGPTRGAHGGAGR